MINFAISCTLLVSVELLGQLAYFVKTGNFLPLDEGANSVQSRVFEIHPYLAIRLQPSIVIENQNKVIKTTALHTRWTGAEEDDHELIRIAILGGSTAFGTGVTDQDSWPALLQAKLGKQFAVINYGVPGYSTAENIVQMALIVPEKRPHIIVFYEGWNDIRNYHVKNNGPDYYYHGVRQYGNLGVETYKKQSRFEDLKNVFASIRLLKKFQNFGSSNTGNNPDIFEIPDQQVDKYYRRNLNTLKMLSENIGALAIFVPQLLNYSDFEGGQNSRYWTQHIKDDAMPFLMVRFNALMDDLCRPAEHQCTVFNEILDEPWHSDDFVDDGHFNRSGGMKFADKIYRLIMAKHQAKVIKNQLSEGSHLNSLVY